MSRLERTEAFDDSSVYLDNQSFRVDTLESLNSVIVPGPYHTAASIERLRRNLKFFFMNPYEKWKAKRRFPWKLLIQLLKIILITVQLSLFGVHHSKFVTFVERNKIAMKHLFLKNWEATYETLPYPPATGAFAIYKQKDLYDYIEHAVHQYYIIPKVGIGKYQLIKTENETIKPMELCITHYKDSHVHENGSFVFDSHTQKDCYLLEMSPNSSRSFKLKEYLERFDVQIDFNIVLDVDLIFFLRLISLDTFSTTTEPKCYQLKVTICFDDNQHDGQVLIHLNTETDPIDCHGKIIHNYSAHVRKVCYLLLYALVLFISHVSLILCTRSLYKAYSTLKIVVKFFKEQMGINLSYSDRFEFINLWYVIIIFNDIMSIIGTIYLIIIASKVFNGTTNDYNVVGLMLGTGSLFTWFGVLRYLGFFAKYNILIITMKKAFPNVMRFVVCVLMMYCGFMFCGWVVLGPYHIKFRTLSSTSECLFSLINGDDMYNTFASLDASNYGVWIYSRAYLYVFICLFIYIVISLFIAVIMDTYETIKHYYEKGFPPSDLFDFINECDVTPDSHLYSLDEPDSCWTKFCSFCRISKRKKKRSKTKTNESSAIAPSVPTRYGSTASGNSVGNSVAI